MNFFPVNLNIRGRTATIVGGGGVACRKCHALLEGGARITIIAPRLDPSLGELRDQGLLTHIQRPYEPGDLAGAFLVFAATDSAAVNRTVAEEAASRGILVSLADSPALGTFTMPSVVRRGELLIAVSTGGKSPALARLIREQLEEEFGPEYAEALAILGAFREKLLTVSKDTAYNKKIFNELAASPLLELVRARRHDAIDLLLTRLAGPGFTRERLGVEKKDSA
ncbi:precorrin-2 dehydrogenase/sirohydrochlorin ferrochelatase family protein [Geobacter pickeringii]|uniref:precorrin-2 dehydrogenase n=1 Tax=Geobacter pickeringii TaxID=345632 RepID=A0A0B5BCM5_9BACT|nr:bifunctional precorrin-2 dehydrogenase/sirohydrochlorin ferrochelatase [Geobacter pickeringii]AJE04463.1 siroheme synthase [Geobacter pickeringii]